MSLRHALPLVLLLCGYGGVSRAHTLELSTARVTLRDAHLEVVVELDPFLLISGEPSALAVTTDLELAARLGAARQALESQTRLVVDGARVDLTLRGFPAPPELRAMAATRSAAHNAHGELMRLRLEAPQSVPGAKIVALALPPALGPAVVSFVQPTTRYTQSGASASFEVLARDSRIGLSVGRKKPWSFLLGVTAMMAIAAAFFINRNRRNEVTS